MHKILSMLMTVGFSFSLGHASQANAGLENFEYTVADVNGDGSLYEYNFQFWVDLSDPDYSSTLGYNSINVNIGEGSGPRPFGNNFITDVSPGFIVTDFTGLPNFTGIRPDGPGFPFWQPNEDDFVVRFAGFSSVLADMTWNYFGRTDVDNSASLFSGAGVQGRLISSPVDSLTDFSMNPNPDPSMGVPVPPSLPLLLAGCGAFAFARRLNGGRVDRS